MSDEWMRTPLVRPWVRADTLVVMPDHFHAVVFICDAPQGSAGNIHWRRGVLGTVVNGVKAASSRRIRIEANPDFGWQPRFHDVIIRSEEHLEQVRKYVSENPARAWARLDAAADSTRSAGR